MIEPGDILTHTDGFGVVRRWRVSGVYLGGEKQESVVQIMSVSHSGPTADGLSVPMYVPEILLRDLKNQAEQVRGTGRVFTPYSVRQEPS
jgi:hypothetical protein